MDANSMSTIGRAVDDIALKLQEIGKILQSFAPENQPKPVLRTKQEFLDNLYDIINKAGLGTFYKPGDTRLTAIAQNAEERLKDPSTGGTLNLPSEVEGLSQLALYDNIIFCDDSGSMDAGRKNALRILVGRVAQFTTYLDTDGIDIRFMNYNGDSGYNNIFSASEVDTIINSVNNDGSTPIGTKLLEKVVQAMILSKADKKALKKPILVTIVTDGEPNSEPTDQLKQTILQCRNGLRRNGYNPKAVKFQISQVGDSTEAEKFIMGLNIDKEISPHIHCTAEKIDQKLEYFNQRDADLEKWVLDFLLYPINLV